MIHWYKLIREIWKEKYIITILFVFLMKCILFNFIFSVDLFSIVLLISLSVCVLSEEATQEAEHIPSTVSSELFLYDI